MSGTHSLRRATPEEMNIKLGLDALGTWVPPAQAAATGAAATATTTAATGTATSTLGTTILKMFRRTGPGIAACMGITAGDHFIHYFAGDQIKSDTFRRPLTGKPVHVAVQFTPHPLVEGDKPPARKPGAPDIFAPTAQPPMTAKPAPIGRPRASIEATAAPSAPAGSPAADRERARPRSPAGPRDGRVPRAKQSGGFPPVLMTPLAFDVARLLRKRTLAWGRTVGFVRDTFRSACDHAIKSAISHLNPQHLQGLVATIIHTQAGYEALIRHLPRIARDDPDRVRLLLPPLRAAAKLNYNAVRVLAQIAAVSGVLAPEIVTVLKEMAVKDRRVSDRLWWLIDRPSCATSDALKALQELADAGNPEAQRWLDRLHSTHGYLF